MSPPPPARVRSRVTGDTNMRPQLLYLPALSTAAADIAALNNRSDQRASPRNAIISSIRQGHLTHAHIHTYARALPLR